MAPLDPAEFPAEIRNYAGQQVDNGDKARVYANDFIGEHLEGVAGGKTYSEVSSAAIAVNAQIASTPKTDPNYATLQAQLATLNGQKATLFQGEMLRGTLLNSWGWWTLGVYTTYAGIGLLIAALGALGALVFELFVAVRKPELDQGQARAESHRLTAHSGRYTPGGLRPAGAVFDYGWETRTHVALSVLPIAMVR